MASQVFRDTKLIGAINPDTEVFIQYIEDVNKAGKSYLLQSGNKLCGKVEEENQLRTSTTTGTTAIAS